MNATLRNRIVMTRRLPGRLRLCIILAVTGSLLGSVIAPPASSAQPKSDLPRVHLGTAYVPPSGRTITVPAGGSLQAALDAAQPGDVIALEAGATFTGPFILPKKPGAEWITIRSSARDDLLPQPGTRVSPSDAHLMPKLVASSGSVISAPPGAHHYRFLALEISPTPNTFLHNLVRLGYSEAGVADLPHDIIFDRCYLHGDPRKGARRGIALNSRSTSIIDSHLSDFKEVGADSQSIAGWNGPGPFKILNNYLEAAGENVMFGGADPSIPGLVPSDIEIRQNHFTKPLSWKIGHPTYAGTPWSIKNLFELKNARRVLVTGNLFEYNWGHAQDGFAINLKSTNQEGTAPWSVTEDVTFVGNIVRHTGSGIKISGYGTPDGQQTKRIIIGGNLFDDVNGTNWGGAGIFLQLVNAVADVVVDHNTVLQSGSIVVADGQPSPGFVFRNNIVPHNLYGVKGSGTTTGQPTLNAYFPGFVFVRNIIPGASPASYPPGNSSPTSLDAVGFIDRVNGDYRLGPSSRYKGAGTDNKDPGADITLLLDMGTRAGSDRSAAGNKPARPGTATPVRAR